MEHASTAVSDARDVTLTSTLNETQLAEAKTLIREYTASLGIDLAFQNLETELSTLPGKYAAAQGGTLILATVDGEPAGCVAMRRLTAEGHDNACEMKRLYVRAQFRGMALGGRLATAIMDAGRAAGYDWMLLDTLETMGSARALYSKMGFVEIEPYYYNPIAGTIYMRAPLSKW